MSDWPRPEHDPFAPWPGWTDPAPRAAEPEANRDAADAAAAAPSPGAAAAEAAAPADRAAIDRPADGLPSWLLDTPPSATPPGPSWNPPPPSTWSSTGPTPVVGSGDPSLADTEVSAAAPAPAPSGFAVAPGAPSEAGAVVASTSPPSGYAAPPVTLRSPATDTASGGLGRPVAPPIAVVRTPGVPLSPPLASEARTTTIDEPRRPRRLGRSALAVAAALGLLAGGVGIGLALDDEGSAMDAMVSRDEGVDTPASAPTDSATIDETEAVERPTDGPVAPDTPEPVSAVAAAVAPSVVRIDTATGTGSGIVYDDAERLIVTNAHVVNGVTEVQLQFADGVRTSGTVVGAAPAVDVAVVRVDDTEVDLVEAVFAPSVEVEVGQLAVAIGSPFGLEQSVTAGIISAVNRVVENSNVADGSPTVVEMVQTDAPINPGNSGGALADREGRVVGMNTAIRTDGTTQGNLGVGFAIPSDTVLLIADRITSGASLDSGFLGISGSDPTTGRPGALVTDVVAGGPAAAAGLQSGDLIVGVDGQPVLGMSELAAKVRLSPPGTEITLEVVREEGTVEATVILGTLGAG